MNIEEVTPLSYRAQAGRVTDPNMVSGNRFLLKERVNMQECRFEGPIDANIMIIGGAPSFNDCRKGRPFSDGSGSILNKLLPNAGIARVECRVGNICSTHAPGGHFSFFYKDENINSYNKGVANLFKEIEKTKPNVILALGEEVLRVLTGREKIGNWRGSVIWNKNILTKVIPSYRPVFIRKQYDAAALLLLDLKKVREESKTLEYTHPNKTLVIRPTFEQVIHEMDRLENNNKPIAFDVETTRVTDDEPLYMTSISFADCSEWAFCIPMQADLNGIFWSFEEYKCIIERLKQLFESGIPVIAQNAQFDVGVLKYVFRIKVKNLLLDTMCAFHTLYPELPKGLNMLRTIYTNCPYYDYWKYEGDDQFYRYNCMDSIIAYESAFPIIEELKEYDLYTFYKNFVHDLIPILLDMQLSGMKINVPLMIDAAKLKEEEYEVAGRKLTDLAVQETGGVWEGAVNPNSTKDLRKLLYEVMKLPVKTHAKTGNPTTDQKALDALHKKYPSDMFDLIVEARHTRKMSSTYLSVENVKYGRMHTSYNIGGRIKDDMGRVVSGPETGRLSSSASIIIKSGTNFQNIPHGVYRAIFIPDDDMKLGSIDLRQADARVVGYEANEKRMIAIFEDPHGDIHQLTADSLPRMFKPKGSEYRGHKNPRRLFAKKHVHAFNYGEGERNFALMSGCTNTESKDVKNNYFNTFPLIRERQNRYDDHLSSSRIITTPFGRRRQFFGRWGSELKKQAYAYVPQSTVADVLNLALIKTHMMLKEQVPSAEILLQVHDSFVFQYEESTLPMIIQILNLAFNIPITFEDRTFTIPTEVEIGKNWEEMEKYCDVYYVKGRGVVEYV